MMNKTCDNFEELIDLKAAGWLSPEEATALDQHLESCPACRAQAALAESAAGVLAAFPAPAAPVIDVASFPSPTPTKPWKWLLIPAAAACLTLVLWVRLLDVSAPSVVGRDPVPVAPRESHAVRALSEAPPTLATYHQALSLPLDDLDRVLEAHDRQIMLYEPGLTLLASHQTL